MGEVTRGGQKFLGITGTISSPRVAFQIEEGGTADKGTALSIKETGVGNAMIEIVVRRYRGRMVIQGSLCAGTGTASKAATVGMDNSSTSSTGTTGTTSTLSQCTFF